jgi:type VII secretion protein EccB
VATKKDLVEAHAFSRRRLVTAFVSGAPGGREVEPTRPMRAVFGGVAICVLLLAGAAIAGVFAPRTEDNWLEPNNLIVSKEKGTLYLVVSEGDSVILRPFVNATSAQLLLGDKDPSRAAQDEIDQQTIGTEIGILGAPSSIPSPSHLVPSGWTACTSSDDGILTRIASDPGGTEVKNGATVVQTPDGRQYLIAYAATDYNDDPQAVSFRLPDVKVDLMLGDLDLGQATDAIKVDSLWLDLFKQYPDDLDASAFHLGTRGPVDYADEIDGASHQVGDVIDYQGQLYLLANEGPAELTPFAWAVYKATVADKPPTTVTQGPANLIPQEHVWPAQWPEGELQLIQGDACAMLVPRHQQSATLRLVRDEVADASPEGVTKGSSAIRVQPGYGALVAPGDFDATSAPTKYFIDANGRAHRVEDKATLEHLGYAGAAAPVIPDPWLELFQTGTPLSAEAAGRQPDETPGAK